MVDAYLSTPWALARVSEVRNRKNPVRVTGTTTNVRIDGAKLPADTTYDLRQAQIDYGTGRYTVQSPSQGATKHLGIIGGTIKGTVDEHVPRNIIYVQQYDCPAIIVDDPGPLDSSRWYVLDQQQIYNTGDGWRTNANGFVISDGYLRIARDDAVENDPGCSGVIVNCLIERAFMGISSRPTNPKGQQPGSITLENVLLGLGMHGYLTGMGDPPVAGAMIDGRCCGHLFKWSGSAPQLILKDCTFFVPWISCNGKTPMKIPPGTQATNCTLVWGGQGNYPGALVPGITVTTDYSVWRNKRSEWLTAHNIPDIDAGP